MKRNVLFAIIVTVIIPTLLISFLRERENNTDENIDQPEEIVIQQEQENPAKQKEIKVLTNDSVETMVLEDYIIGVVLGEMPVQFHMEALKAQAIVARTYTCKSMRHSKHETVDVCTDSSCCQAYMAPDQYLQSGGSQSLLDQVMVAVEETCGQVLTYNGELIEATYFSCSGGRTEPAVAVWGSDVPYLQAVDSPGEENATHYIDTVKFTQQEFCEKLGTQFVGPSERWVESISYTDGGGVAYITLNGHTFSGTDIRRRLNLRSTAFVISTVGDTVTVTTKGFGHRVGMSQYGAQAMALKGEAYEKILAHYYPGTELTAYVVDKDS